MCFIIPPLQWRGWYTLIFFKQLSSKISQQALITDASKFNTLFVKPWDPFFYQWDINFMLNVEPGLF